MKQFFFVFGEWNYRRTALKKHAKHDDAHTFHCCMGSIFIYYIINERIEEINPRSLKSRRPRRLSTVGFSKLIYKFTHTQNTEGEKQGENFSSSLDRHEYWQKIFAVCCCRMKIFATGDSPHPSILERERKDPRTILLWPMVISDNDNIPRPFFLVWGYYGEKEGRRTNLYGVPAGGGFSFVHRSLSTSN